MCVCVCVYQCVCVCAQVHWLMFICKYMNTYVSIYM